MFEVIFFLMFLGSIALPRITNLQAPRTVKVLKPVPPEAVLDRLAQNRIMPAVRTSTLSHPRHLRR